MGRFILVKDNDQNVSFPLIPHFQTIPWRGSPNWCFARLIFALVDSKIFQDSRRQSLFSLSNIRAPLAVQRDPFFPQV